MTILPFHPRLLNMFLPTLHAYSAEKNQEKKYKKNGKHLPEKKPHATIESHTKQSLQIYVIRSFFILKKIHVLQILYNGVFFFQLTHSDILRQILVL